MTNLVNLLQQNIELEKKAYFDYITEMTSAGIQAGVQAGVPFEKAASLVKEACETSEELEVKAFNFQLMEKVAEYVSELEAKVANFEKSASVQAHREEISAPLNKMAQLGFTEEELNALSEVDSTLLEKVANSAGAPVEMGSRVGFAHEKTDPLLQFILG